MLPITAPEYFALAIVFTVLFTISFVLRVVLGSILLRHLPSTVIFRSLGRPYISSLVAMATVTYLCNLVAIWILALVKDEGHVINVVGTLTGLRLWLIGMLMAVLCGRQFMLGRIFGTFGSPSKYQTFWPPVIFATLAWVPMLIVFYLALFLDLDLTIFASLMMLFYALFFGLFAYLAYKNRGITRLFSDYSGNMAVFAVLVCALAVGIYLTTAYQLIAVETYKFETGMVFLTEILFTVALPVVFLPPYITWKHDPQGRKAWNEFNRRNANLYGKDHTGSDRGAVVSDSGLEHAVSHMSELGSKKTVDSEIGVVE